MNGPLSASANERRPKQDDLRIVDRGVDQPQFPGFLAYAVDPTT
jgi:hypothetical protein